MVTQADFDEVISNFEKTISECKGVSDSIQRAIDNYTEVVEILKDFKDENDEFIKASKEMVQKLRRYKV